jgi:protein-histidine pros-kinase
MAAQANRWQRLSAWAARLLPASLFGRLALLLFVTALVSHVLALTLLFELRHEEFGMRPPPPPPPGAQAMHFEPPQIPGEPALWPPEGLLLDIGVRLAALLLAAWVGARWLAQPVRRLVAGAQELGQDIYRPPMAEEGTTECREATRVFNGMQAKIRRQMDDRDRFVAAVSHDLRTPLTRMRLRAEVLEDADARVRFGRDIAEMEAMLRATLDYLRGAADAEAMVPLDIVALATSMADDQQDAGQAVSVTGQCVPLPAQPSALRRCLSNLVENAVRYGGSAEIHLIDSPQQLRIEVADRGPGLPEAELEQVLAPFYRVEASRNRHSGGIGLGLSIAHDIARRHGGTLVLRNRPGGGLVATLELPRGAPKAA